MAQTETLLHDRTVQSMQDLDRTRRTAWRAFQNGLLSEDEFARTLDQIDARLSRHALVAHACPSHKAESYLAN